MTDDRPLAVRQSNWLRGKACNEFLMGMLTGIADFEREGRHVEYTSLMREKLQALFSDLEVIETAEKLGAERRLEELWKGFFSKAQELKPFLGDKAPLPGYWRVMQHKALIDLNEAIIIIFPPNIEESPTMEM